MNPLDVLVVLQESHISCCASIGQPSVLKLSMRANDLICQALDRLTGMDRGFRFISDWNHIPVRFEMEKKDISFAFFV